MHHVKQINIEEMNTNRDLLKATKKANREAEITLYSKQINHANVYRSKKQYTRKAKHKNMLSY